MIIFTFIGLVIVITALTHGFAYILAKILAGKDNNVGTDDYAIGLTITISAFIIVGVIFGLSFTNYPEHYGYTRIESEVVNE